ncbi:hypothetical protein BG004_003305 [Podila humilis]|nr:hypothetical protein BG004_003305 [Podila humilis]
MFYGATSAGGRCTRELSSSSSSPSPTPMSSPSTAGSDSMEPLSPRQESPMLVAEDDSAPLSFSAGVFSSQHTSTSRRRASGYRRISVSSLLNPISDFHIDQSPPPLSPSSSLPSSSSSLSSSIGPSRHRRHKSLASPASSSSSSSTSYVPGQSCGNHGCSSCHGPETPMSFHHRSQYHHHHQPYPYSHPYPQQKPQQLPQLFPCQVHSRERQSSLWRSFEE